MAILLDICVVTDDKHGRQRTRELQSKKEKKPKRMGDPSLFYNENQNGEIRPMFSYVKFFALQ